jgi:hypothetical protein
LPEEEQEGKKTWYTNKDLFKMIVELKELVISLCGQLKETTRELDDTRETIKKYNGLREQLYVCQQDLKTIQGAKQGGKDMWGYIFAALGFTMLAGDIFLRIRGL